MGRHLYRQTFGEEKGQKAPIKVEETEEQKAVRVKEELKKLKVEEDDEGEDLKVKQEEGAEPMKRVKVKRKELRKKELEANFFDASMSKIEMFSELFLFCMDFSSLFFVSSLSGEASLPEAPFPPSFFEEAFFAAL